MDFRTFVDETYPRLVRTAWLLCGDPGRAEDFAQDALLGAYRNWGRLDGDPSAYVFRSVANARSTWWQRQGRFQTSAAVPEKALVDDPTTRIVLQQALASLPRRQRQVVVLRFFADLSVEQTAAALGCSTGTVKSTTHRGLAALREHPSLADLHVENGVF